jgi:transposase InsO family protein
LRHLTIERPSQVWCADVAYIPMRRGFPYLVAIMYWSSRKVLSWRLSNTMEVDFCVAALEEALARFGKPEISNRESTLGKPPFCPGSRDRLLICPAAAHRSHHRPAKPTLPPRDRRWLLGNGALSEP